MKKLFLSLLFSFLFSPIFSWAICNNYPYEICLGQLNSAGNVLLGVGLDEIGTDGILIYDQATHYPAWMHIGSGLSYNSGTATLSASAAQFNFGDPTARTLALSRAYQANDPTKAAVLSLSPQCSASLSLSGGQTCTLTMRVASTAPTCSTGTPVLTWVNGNTGTLTVGLGLTQVMGSPGSWHLGIGRCFILCATTTGTLTVGTVYDQTAQ
jgi:hypothetical protein